MKSLGTVYRGTQRATIEGARGVPSWAFSLPVALIWSANPSLGPAFTSTSTVRVGRATARKPLRLGGSGPYMTLRELLVALRYGKKNGITADEIQSVLRYLHRRLSSTKLMALGRFGYRVVDEEGEPVDESDLPFSLDPRFQQTLISQFGDDLEYTASGKDTLDMADRLTVDAYAFTDSPKVQEVARRVGYDALIYDDVFVGGPAAAEALLGVKEDDFYDLEGVEGLFDLEDEEVPTHLTYRPLTESAIEVVEVLPAAVALERWRSSSEGRAYGRSVRRPMVRRR